MSAPATPTTINYGVRLTPARMNVVTAALLLGVIAYTIPSNMLTPLLVSLEAAYHVSAVAAIWISLVPLLAGAALLPTLCRLGDTMGWKKSVSVGGLVCLLLGALISAVSSNLPLLLVGRFFTGIGAVVFPLLCGIINDEFPLVRRKVAVSMVSACLFLGVGIGGIIAGEFVEHHANFRIVFWGAAVLAVIGLAAVSILVPNGRGPAADAPAKWWQAIDSFGAVGFAIPVIALDIAFSEMSVWGWGSWQVIFLIVLAVAVGIAWVLVERRLRNPLADQSLFWSRPIWVSNSVSILSGFAAIGSIISVSTFAQMPAIPGLNGLGAGPVSGTWVIIPVEWAGLIMGPITGYLSRRVGKGPFLFAGAVFETIGLLLLIGFHGSLAELAICMVVVGIGVGMVISSFALVYVEDVPPEHVGRLFGISTILATGVGGSLGGAVFGAFLSANTLPPVKGLPPGLPSIQAFHGFWLLTAGLTALAAVVASVYMVTYWAGLRGGDRAMVQRPVIEEDTIPAEPVG